MAGKGNARMVESTIAEVVKQYLAGLASGPSGPRNRPAGRRRNRSVNEPWFGKRVIQVMTAVDNAMICVALIGQALTELGENTGQV